MSIRPAVSLPSATRSYHSRFHAPLPTHEYTNSQTTILAAALEHIPEHGFTKDALIMGARDMGFLDVSIQLFTRQEMDLVLYWLASRRGLLRAKVQNGLFEGKQMSLDEKIKTLVIERLRMNSPIIHRWQDVSSNSGGCSSSH
jgi:ubiquinone biosynthesis protein COQ9